MKDRLVSVTLVAITAAALLVGAWWMGFELGRNRPRIFRSPVALDKYDGATHFGWDRANGCVSMWQAGTNSYRWTRLEAL